MLRKKERTFEAEPAGSAPMAPRCFRQRDHPLPSWGCIPLRWAALLWRSSPFVVVALRASVLGCPITAFDCSRRCVVSNVGVGLPTSLWAALPRRSPLFVWFELLRWASQVVVGCPASFPPHSTSCGVRPQRWAAHVVGLHCHGVRVVIGCQTSVLSWGWWRGGRRH